MPSPQTIRDNRTLRVFGEWLHDPNLWHLNRRSAAGAIGVGMFAMWIPVPFQMVIAAAAAIVLKTNLPLSVATVWITNPITIPPMFFFAYILGTWVVGVPATEFNFELSMDWLLNELSEIWLPFLAGCFTLSVVSSIIGYFSIDWLWRHSVLSKRSNSLRSRKPGEASGDTLREKAEDKSKN